MRDTSIHFPGGCGLLVKPALFLPMRVTCGFNIDAVEPFNGLRRYDPYCLQIKHT